jgi:hypothetical protein
MRFLLAVGMFTFGLFSVANAEPHTFTSGQKQVSLVELYTSEGCSSCPPADEWLSTFTESGRLWKEVVPVAFHVDYWDYIGWKDRFAQPQFANRQEVYVYTNQLSGVYTPGVMVNGYEWRGQEEIQSRSDNAGELTLQVEGEKVYVSYKNRDLLVPLNVNIAVLGFDLVSDVNRGENKGRQLKHDFVVLGHKIEMIEKANLKQYLLTTTLPELSVEADKLAVVAWINPPKEMTPMQAVGGYLHD